jgi:histidinol-phosphatase (PHP family)
MSPQDKTLLVSIHGGHSGEFCNHAKETLEQVVQTYIQRGFAWVGITEHIPPVSNKFLYEEEIEAGLDALKMYDRFARYIETGRALQQKYADQIELLVGMEAEGYEAALPFAQHLKETFQLDYLVGSVHHVDNLSFDLNAQVYQQVAQAVGGVETLYCRYFDQQYEMLQHLQPQVVGHFDYIRLFDPDYRQRLQQPEILARIERNLSYIKSLKAILDFNVSPLRKGADEPYVSRAILLEARQRGISVVPGDDSHGIQYVGQNIPEGIQILQELGFDLTWQKPLK